MNENQLKELLGQFKADLLSAVEERVAKAAPAAPPKTEPKTEPKAEELARPTFTGDPSKVEDLEAFERTLKAYEINKALQEGKLTAKELAELRKSLSEGQPNDEDAGIEAEDTAEVKDLKRQLFKAKRTSKAPEAKVSKSADEAAEQAKAMVELGKSIAKSVSGTDRPSFQVLKKTA
jgi:hypothetical protein